MKAEGTEYAHLDFHRPWPEFYQTATASQEVFLVKTHRMPIDAQPAIYVVRDGRSACQSYSEYQKKYLGGNARPLLEIVLGDDIYGGWSQHFNAWASNRANTLLLRFEDMVDPTQDTLAKLAKVVRHHGGISEWCNPFGDLHQVNPDFYRSGKKEWERSPVWAPLIDGVFNQLHGDLMVDLGYAEARDVESARQLVSADERMLLETAGRLISEKKHFEQVCQERQMVIDGLSLACQERLDLIHRLETELKSVRSPGKRSGVCDGMRQAQEGPDT